MISIQMRKNLCRNLSKNLIKYRSENNFVRLNNYNIGVDAAKSFILATSLNVLRNYFDKI